jgi:hypothetical protein
VDVRRHTQTDFTPGNCVQTAVACILDLEPEEVLDQRLFRQVVPREDGMGMRWGTPRYMGALDEWLRSNFGCRFEFEAWPARLRTRGLHIMTGRTVRTRTNGGLRHAVVAEDLFPIWDPHPSRDMIIPDREASCVFLVPCVSTTRQRHTSS